jgi:hypothetical protein
LGEALDSDLVTAELIAYAPMGTDVPGELRAMAELFGLSAGG